MKIYNVGEGFPLPNNLSTNKKPIKRGVLDSRQSRAFSQAVCSQAATANRKRTNHIPLRSKEIWFELHPPPQTKNPMLSHWVVCGGGCWIRTSEVVDNRFTVCPLWPLGKSPILKLQDLELVNGVEPSTC